MYTPTNSPRQDTTGRGVGLAVSLLAVTTAAIILAVSLSGVPAAATPGTTLLPIPNTDHIDLTHETPDPKLHAEPGKMVITGADADTHVMVTDSIDLYAAAGLGLPNLRINVHPTNDGCDGHQGLYRKGGDLYRIDICTAHPITIAHELAHAWERHNVDDATRDRYVDLVGAAQWYDQDAPHPVRAIEQAADVIAWGVQGQPIQRLLAAHHADELAAYELLTGRPSPRIGHWGDPVGDPARTMAPGPDANHTTGELS